jgi:predicted nucleic acid-binding protein
MQCEYGRQEACQQSPYLPGWQILHVLPLSSLCGHQQITDAYLLALCRERSGRLVTFDGGIPALARTDAERAAILLLT